MTAEHPRRRSSDSSSLRTRLVAAAAAAFDEYETLVERRANLLRLHEELADEVYRWHVHAGEQQRELQRLRRPSLAWLLALMSLDRAERVAYHQAQAETAWYWLRHVQERTDGVWQAYEQVNNRLRELSHAPATLAALMDELEDRLYEAGDPRAGQLLELAAEAGEMRLKQKEVVRVAEAATAAGHAAAQVRDQLTSARYLSGLNLWFGGGWRTYRKQRRLEKALAAARVADQHLAILRIGLADVVRLLKAAPPLEIPHSWKVFDLLANDIITVVAIHLRIKRAQANVEHIIHELIRLHAGLQATADDLQRQQALLQQRRRELILAGPAPPPTT